MRKIIFLAVLAIFLAAPVLAWGAPACTDPASSSLCNPLATNKGIFPAINSFPEFVIFVLGVFGGLAGIASIVYITFAGFLFLISQGNEEKVVQAKSTVQWTLVGLVLMIVSFALVQALQKSLRYKGVSDPDQLTNPVGLTNFTQLYQRVIQGFFEMMALLAVLMIVVGGYRYITSNGNGETAKAAKNTMLYSVVGIAIAVFGYVIVHSIGAFFEKP